jgi:D-3-phosphoglycerate dehydrogenase
MCKEGVIIVNTARGGLVDEAAVAEACRTGRIKAYAADVLATEPMQTPHPFQEIDNILITPHVGSRTYESVERQAVRATKNIVNYMTGDDDYIQANTF